MRSNNILLRTLRTIHLYLGVFTTPALLFFAITGGLQTFSLHETTKGSSYKPPKILVELGTLHKKQNFSAPTPRPQPSPGIKPAGELAMPPTYMPAAKPASETAAAAHAVEGRTAERPSTAKSAEPEKKNLLPMKIFFLIVSISLFTSALTGLYLSYKYIRNKLLVTTALVAGIAIPLVILLVS